MRCPFSVLKDCAGLEWLAVLELTVGMWQWLGTAPQDYFQGVHCCCWPASFLLCVGIAPSMWCVFQPLLGYVFIFFSLPFGKPVFVFCMSTLEAHVVCCVNKTFAEVWLTKERMSAERNLARSAAWDDGKEVCVSISWEEAQHVLGEWQARNWRADGVPLEIAEAVCKGRTTQEKTFLEAKETYLWSSPVTVCAVWMGLCVCLGMACPRWSFRSVSDEAGKVSTCSLLWPMSAHLSPAVQLQFFQYCVPFSAMLQISFEWGKEIPHKAQFRSLLCEGICFLSAVGKLQTGSKEECWQSGALSCPRHKGKQAAKPLFDEQLHCLRLTSLLLEKLFSRLLVTSFSSCFLYPELYENKIVTFHLD